MFGPFAEGPRGRGCLRKFIDLHQFFYGVVPSLCTRPILGEIMKNRVFSARGGGGATCPECPVLSCNEKKVFVNYRPLAIFFEEANKVLNSKKIAKIYVFAILVIDINFNLGWRIYILPAERFLCASVAFLNLAFLDLNNYVYYHSSALFMARGLDS